MNSSVRAVYRIATGHDGPRDARRIVDDELGGRLPQPQLDRLKLLISELVTSRIVNRAPNPAGRLIIDVRADRVVRCAVVDDGPATLPQEWALLILEQLSDRWGLTRSCNETRTWVEADALLS